MWYNINRTGRLGNRLFSRAHIYAAALELGETVIDWGLNDYKNYFPNCKRQNYQFTLYKMIISPTIQIIF